MPQAAEITKGPGPWVKHSWSEFKKFIDGTYAFLSFNYQNGSNYYHIVTEIFGGFNYECIITKDAGADQTDFETNFQNLILRTAQITVPLSTLYDIQETVIYIGSAKGGSSSASAVWTIKRVTLASGIPTIQKTTAAEAAVWNDRVTETYY